MRSFMKTIFYVLASLVSSVLVVSEVNAVQITLNLVQAESQILLTGAFSGLPFLSQDVPAPGAPVPGTTDYDPTRPSNHTTFQGTITVDVDNIMSPSSIKILSSNADADLSGAWLPEVEPYLDVNGNGVFGEFGDDSVSSVGDNPAPATDADWGIRIFHPAFGVNVAYAADRDIVYNVTSAVEAVNPLGEFNSSTENFEFATGWIDYWVAPAAGGIRGRSELAGGDDDNATLLPSTYTVTPLPGIQKEVRLFIPIDINAPGEDADFFYDGQFVATLIVIPEPSSFMLLGLAGMLAALLGHRHRR